MKNDTANTPNEEAIWLVNRGRLFCTLLGCFTTFSTPSTTIYTIYVNIAIMPIEPAFINTFKSFNMNNKPNTKTKPIPTY